MTQVQLTLFTQARRQPANSGDEGGCSRPGRTVGSRQNREVRIRREVQQPIEVIQAATTNAAELLGMAGDIGTLQAGAHADLIVLDRDPLADIDALGDPRHITHVVQAGTIVRLGGC